MEWIGRIREQGPGDIVVENVSPDGHALTHFVPKMPIGKPTLDAVLTKIHMFRAVIPLCIHVGEIDGELMVCPPRIRFNVHTNTHVVYPTHVFAHVWARAPRTQEGSIYTLRQLVNLSKLVQSILLRQLSFIINLIIYLKYISKKK